MKKIAYVIFLATSLLFTACGGSDPEIDVPVHKGEEENKPVVQKEKEIYFTTEVSSRSCTQLLEKISENESLGVMLTYTTDTASSGVKEAIYKNGMWKGKNSLMIKENDTAKMYAFYPYKASATSGKAIPVEITSQTDYLYSPAGSLTYAEPTAKLTMKHALPILAFNIDKASYSGEGILKSIRMEGDGFYTEGTLDVTTGTITGTKSAAFTLAPKQSYQIVNEGWKEDLPDFFCLPSKLAADEVALTFQIDNKEFTCQLPKMDILSGSKYILRFTLSDEKFTLNEKDIVMVALNTDTDEMPIERGSYGLISITHTNLTITAPMLMATSGLIATIDWGDQQSEPYDKDDKHTYAAPGTYTLSIESYGAEEFTLKDMVGITQIDLTQF